MADKEDQLEIDLAETPAAAGTDDIRVETAPEGAEIAPEDGINALKSQLEAEKNARIAAERSAEEAKASSVRLQAELQDNNLHLVANAITTVKKDIEITRENLRRAMESNDHEATIELNETLSRANSQLTLLENGKKELEKQANAPVLPPQSRVEQLASQLTPRSADWIRKHPEYANDDDLNAAMLGAHNLVIRRKKPDGTKVVPESDEYFEEVEKLLGIRASAEPREVTEEPAPLSAAATPTKTRTSPPAAPVSRNGTGVGSSRTVRLTPAEVEIAKLNGMSPEEYGKNKLALMKEGKIGRAN